MELKFTAPTPPEQFLSMDDALMHNAVASEAGFACTMIVPRDRFADMRDALGQRGIAVIADTPKFIFGPDNNRAYERLSGVLA